jgi:hypothetical protein
METSQQDVSLPLHPAPAGFNYDIHHFHFIIPAERQKVWAWLNDPDTFTRGQVWPFRVEFVSPQPDQLPADFSEGVFNNHHGPLINFAGKLTAVESPRYRDLHYLYGSYAISFRLIRPCRLQFWLDEVPEGTLLRGQLDAHIRPWLVSLWNSVQGIFWRRFRSWSRFSIRKGK